MAEAERLLTRSKVFGSIWLMGIGSVICILSAYKASQILKAEGVTDRKISGLYLLGFTGVAVAVASLLIILIFRKGKNL
ncbi:MAG: hypothetical protein K1X85_00145 [Ignavibacteria bacterium]|nr:hypothetical protein [Ignavibacteria bacterium]